MNRKRINYRKITKKKVKDLELKLKESRSNELKLSASNLRLDIQLKCEVDRLPLHHITTRNIIESMCKCLPGYIPGMNDLIKIDQLCAIYLSGILHQNTFELVVGWFIRDRRDLLVKYDITSNYIRMYLNNYDKKGVNNV